jgi:dethiobiotin synthetase
MTPPADDRLGVLLVTGTDTGVGKTVVTAALAVVLAGPAVFKVVQAGLPADADEVRRLTGLTAVHEGGRVEDPLNPTTAARLHDVKLPGVAEHAATVRRLADEHGTVIVEGAGGLLVGLDNDGRTLPDLAAELGIPHTAVVVTRAGLGTLNHTRLTVEALRARQIPVAGIVIGSWPADPGLAERCNLDDLPAVTGVPVIGRVSAGAGTLDRATFAAAAKGWFDLPWT